MTISPEVKMAVDEIHRERNALAAAYKANELQASQLADLKGQIEAAHSLSDEDRRALLDAVNEAGETSDALAVAVPANVDGAMTVSAAPTAATPPPDDPTAPRPDPIAGTGLSGTVPLMPNSAFDPAGGVKTPVADAGQPNQSQAIETAGGFVIAGGGSVQRAPGSRPESPSSSLVLLEDPDAKGAASTADEVKSGLGDSSQNALKGADGRPVSEGPGIVKEPSPEAAKEAQAQQDALNKEKAAREANPLNLSPEDLAKREQADAGKGTADDKAKSDGNGPGVPAGAATEPMQPRPDPNAGKPVAAL